MITEFQGDYRWLSNFSPVEVSFDGFVFPSVEHAYQAAKNINDEEWVSFCLNNTAGAVKKASRKLKLSDSWMNQRVLVMLSLLIQKFMLDEYHRNKLLETGETHIQEGNNWGDVFWGVDLKTGDGKNMLGVMIMNIRSRLLIIQREKNVESN